MDYISKTMIKNQNRAAIVITHDTGIREARGITEVTCQSGEKTQVNEQKGKMLSELGIKGDHFH